MTVKSDVAAKAADFQKMDYAALLAYGRVNYDSRAGFSAYKKALAAIGIDFDAMKVARRQEKSAALAGAATAGLTLITDAKARTRRFAVCDKSGAPVWHGRFFDDDRDFDGEQSSGEMAAAKKAVWLASKVAEAVGATAIRLTLKVDAEWLCYANAVADGSDAGGKARALGELAQRLNVALTVEHIPGVENPADPYTTCQGFKKWQDNDLRALVG